MAESAEIKTKRVARNTAILYVRTFVTFCIGLFTSRIMLEALGIDNYGINNVVGGFVSMFGIVTGTLTSSIGRYLTFGLGEGDLSKLRVTFSTSVNVLSILAGIVFILGETLGLWFVNTQLEFPPGRLFAANCVYQFSIFSTMMGLICMPYDGVIVAHEKINLYAYISIIDVGIKLLLCYILFIIPFDRLIFFAGFTFFITILKRIFLGWYCKKNFAESHYIRVMDKGLLKEMSKFATWIFFGNTSWILNNQGINILINIFFGVAFNAARGIAQTVQTAVMGFVYNLDVAFTPQITKSYAEGDLPYMYSIMERTSKFSVYLMMVFVIPVVFEIHTVLHLWLGEYPAYSAIFLRLSLVGAGVLLMGNTFLKGIQAKGDMKNYTITVNFIAWSCFPLSWLAYKIGWPVESSYYIFIIVYTSVVFIRTWYVEKLLGYPAKRFYANVFRPIISTLFISVIPPLLVFIFMPPTILRLFILTSVSVISVCSTIYFIGVNPGEREFIKEFIFKWLRKVHIISAK